VGRISNVETAQRDVVERADQALRDGLGTFVQFLEDLPVAVFVIDASGRPFYANRASRELLGKGVDPDIAPEELASTYRTYVAGTDQEYPVERMPIMRALAGESHAADDFEIRLPDRTICVEVWASPILDARGDVIYAIAAFRDVTERKRLEEDRRKLDAEEARFVADAAHELRTPLTTLAGFVELLARRRREMSEEELDEFFALMRRSAARINALVAHLLDLSRLEHGGTLDLRPVGVSDAAHRALEVAPPPSDVTVDIACAEGLVARADPARLDQVIVNLLANAYAYGGPSVRVEARADGGSITVSVSDDGLGVPPELVTELFEPFTRGANAGPAPGSGLGLAITKRIVDAFEAEIRYEPNRPSGARFILQLPRA
jgi:PAS domain S-box-containing protein